ncbi:MAG TPA: fibro-slime domain-containing protein [Polyangiaceae bacterium]|nr:fibro-slime domain-containing protein [Polyangiaceae bacterium]
MNVPPASRLALVLSLSLFAVACGGDDDSSNGLGKGAEKSGSGGSGGSSTVIVTGGSTGSGATNGSGGGGNATASGGTGPYMLPAGFTKADDGGGWKLGDPVVEGQPPPDTSTSGMGCGQQILGIVRDFRRFDETNGHPDFQHYQGQGQPGAVQTALGSDQKPVFNPAALNQTPCTADDTGKAHSCFTSADDYTEWYNDDANVNDPYYIFFSLQPNGGTASFHSSAFFPLDHEGFDTNMPDKDGHNFSFTTEVHTTFLYSGGETFTFEGDDDVWVFINGQLAIDLGGLHSEQHKSIDLDQSAKTLGITTGQVYPLDLFHAERHTDQSNFKITSTLYFVDCGVIVPSGQVK